MPSNYQTQGSPVAQVAVDPRIRGLQKMVAETMAEHRQAVQDDTAQLRAEMAQEIYKCTVAAEANGQTLANDLERLLGRVVTLEKARDHSTKEQLATLEGKVSTMGGAANAGVDKNYRPGVRASYPPNFPGKRSGGQDAKEAPRTWPSGLPHQIGRAHV